MRNFKMTNDELDELERPYREMLAMIERDYRKQCKPYIDGLVRLRNLRTQPLIRMVSVEDFAKTGIKPVEFAPFGESCDHPFMRLQLNPEGYKCMRCGKQL